MRMWMVNPAHMCRKHLLGEHVEHHMIVGALNKGKSIKGYLQTNMLEPASLISRHQELADEMAKRGYNHQSPLQKQLVALSPKDNAIKINQVAAWKDLSGRCTKCAARANKEAI